MLFYALESRQHISHQVKSVRHYGGILHAYSVWSDHRHFDDGLLCIRITFSLVHICICTGLFRVSYIWLVSGDMAIWSGRSNLGCHRSSKVVKVVAVTFCGPSLNKRTKPLPFVP